jgi:hypothetical protein
MVAFAEVAVIVLLGAAFIWWFRRTPMFRANRMSGVVPGQWSAQSSSRAHGVGGTPATRPVLRPEEDPRRSSKGARRGPPESSDPA